MKGLVRGKGMCNLGGGYVQVYEDSYIFHRRRSLLVSYVCPSTSCVGRLRARTARNPTPSSWTKGT